MNEFIGNAQGILETACAGAAHDQEPSALSILIGGTGGIRVVIDSEWSLDRLKSDQGARLAYRVSWWDGKVRVLGLSESQSCVLESEVPALAAHRLLAGLRSCTVEVPARLAISKSSNPSPFGR